MNKNDTFSVLLHLILYFIKKNRPAVSLLVKIIENTWFYTGPFGNCLPGTELLQSPFRWSLAWDHLCGDIDDICGITADFCEVIADPWLPAKFLRIPEAIGGRAVGDADRCATH